MSLNQTDKEVTLSDITVDENGNLYIIGMQHPKRYEDVPTLYCYLWKGDVFQKMILGKSGQMIYGTKLFIGEGGENPLVC